MAWAMIEKCVPEDEPEKPERESAATDTYTSSTEPDPSDPDPGREPDPVLEDMGREPEKPDEEMPARDEEGCHAIYAQDHLPEFELTISDKVWNALVWEWNNGQMNEDLGVDPDPYHELAEFRYGDIVITDAEIRLRQR
jgi:hypothetical protein